ncbi:hypothetical protein [Nocardia sp. BMG51109]|uniref:hypothetical protein n=1 Tax=Nocardia sp. BMG51109 TaxID=1056816 RepID=UPI0012EC2174|nr:hypothetical protein [Nocardia sp. BMG51109]
MGYRSVFGFGILAAGFIGAAGVSAPVATAELPPGFSCDGNRCTNDTDDQYLVNGTVFCHETNTIAPVQFLVSAHGYGRPVVPCYTRTMEGPDGIPRTAPSNNYSQLHVDSAVVHNGPWVNSGSAG